MKKPRVLKNEIGHSIIWLGTRYWDMRDVSDFLDCAWRIRGNRKNFFEYPQVEIYRENHKRYLAILRRIIADSKEIMRHNRSRHVFFIIVSDDVVQAPWFKVFLNVFVKQAFKYACWPYLIMCGRGDFVSQHIYDQHTENSFFWPAEAAARELGGFYSYFDSDAPSAGMERLAEMIHRLIGGDLPGEEFPAFSFNEGMQIAWNLNRENFNAFSRRQGSVDKYPIGEDGRPIFAIPVSSLQGLPAPPTMLLE
jgi:hypothetical protein